MTDVGHPNAIDTIYDKLNQQEQSCPPIDLITKSKLEEDFWKVKFIKLNDEGWDKSAVGEAVATSAGSSSTSHDSPKTIAVTIVDFTSDSKAYRGEDVLNLNKNQDRSILGNNNEEIIKIESDDEEKEVESVNEQPKPLGFLEAKQKQWDIVLTLLNNLESVLRNSGLEIPKRDKLLNNFFKWFRDFLRKDFENFIPEFRTSDNKAKVQNYEAWLIAYASKLFGTKKLKSIGNMQYYGKWNSVEFTIGSFIWKDIMKQLITSSKEKAYFYGLHKWLKNCSQKKLAVILKNHFLVDIIYHMLNTDLVYDFWESMQ